MTQEPTDAQVKEFWEWCGFEYFKADDAWCFPDTKAWGLQPKLDLNNLFKYGKGKVKELPELKWAKLFVDWLQAVLYDDEDPALALFWLFWEVMHER